MFSVFRLLQTEKLFSKNFVDKNSAITTTCIYNNNNNTVYSNDIIINVFYTGALKQRKRTLTDSRSPMEARTNNVGK